MLGYMQSLTKIEVTWYERAIQSVSLQEHLCNLPKGDETPVVNDGVALSGDQKHRVAIARVVYSRKTVAVFDETVRRSHLSLKKMSGSNGVL